MAKRKITLSVILVLVVVVCLYLLRVEHLAATAKMASWSGVGNMDLWQGTWISDKTKKTGLFQVALTQEGPNITGNIKIGGSLLTKGGEIKGTIDGDKLEFGLVKDKRGELKYSGTISENTMAGTWQVPRIKAQGTWQAAKK